MLLKKIFDWLLSLFKFKNTKSPVKYKLTIVSELPENIIENILYVEGVKEYNDFWYAMLKCPCGCNENIMLNLMTDAKPCWKVTLSDSNFSITPSIWRTKNCKSHFWLTDRKIIWV